MDGPNDAFGDPRQLRCCACGNVVVEADMRRIAQAWWSAGAHEGRLEVERERGKP
jgi:hypothetical protein